MIASYGVCSKRHHRKRRNSFGVEKNTLHLHCQSTGTAALVVGLCNIGGLNSCNMTKNFKRRDKGGNDLAKKMVVAILTAVVTVLLDNK